MNNTTSHFNQKGIAHVVLIALIALVVGVAGFAGYRLYAMQTEKANLTQVAKITTAKKTETVKTASPAAPAETVPTTVTFSTGGASISGDTVKVAVSTDNPQSGTCSFIFKLGGSTLQRVNTIDDSRTCAASWPLSDFSKSGKWYYEVSFISYDGKISGKGGQAYLTIGASAQPRVISFTKGGGSLNGSNVSVSATLSEAQTGTCSYKFSLNGTTRVEKTSSITRSQTCAIDVPVSAFPKSATYSLKVTFASSDGLMSAEQAAYDITVQ